MDEAAAQNHAHHYARDEDARLLPMNRARSFGDAVASAFRRGLSRWSNITRRFRR